MRRGLAVAGILLWLAVAAVPTSTALVVGEAVPHIVLGATLDAEVQVESTLGVVEHEQAPIDEQVDPRTTSCRGQASFEANATAFTINESAEAQACTRVRIGLTVPAGVVEASVSFWSDRQVTFPEQDLVPAVSIVQEFSAWNGENATLAPTRYIAPGTPVHELQKFEYGLAALNASETLVLEWFVQDEGTGDSDRAAPGLLGAETLVHVMDVRVIWQNVEGVAIGDAIVAEARAINATQRIGVVNQAVHVNTPFDDASTWRLSVSYPSREPLLAIEGPGRAAGDGIDQVVEQGSATATVFLDPEGASGTYTFQFLAERSVPAPPPQVFPDIQPTYQIAVGLGAVTAGGLGYSSFRYYRASEGVFRRNAGRAFAGVFLLLLYFVFQVLYTWLVIGIDDMSTLDHDGPFGLFDQAFTFYVQIFLVIILMTVLWYLFARTELQRMKADIRERQAREEDLRRSNEELEQFAYVASHDLQEPLRKVASYTQLLERKYRDDLDEEAHEFIDYAVSGAKRMQALIAAILEYSRIGKADPSFAPVNLQEVVDAIRGDLEMSLKESGGRIVAKDLPTIVTDQVWLQQLMHNLISNGLKFRRPNVKPQVTVTVERLAHNWCIMVQDNGIGIPKQHQEMVFAVFRRLHRQDEYPGTGIGLATCRKIVDALGGEIRVESEPGKGSTFFVELPGGRKA